MAAKVKVTDLSEMDEAGESVALVYFEDLQGIVHIYRDGTVVLSSPAGITVTSLRRIDDQTWRREHFLSILARMGASDQELSKAAQMIPSREEALSRQGFPAAVKQVAEESVSHFKTWCKEHGVDYGTMTEEEIDRLLEDALSEIRER